MDLTAANIPALHGTVARVVDLLGSVGYATFGHTAIARHFDPKRHRRVVLFRDDQQHDSGRVRLDHVPLILTFNWLATGRRRCRQGSMAASRWAASPMPRS